MFIFSSENHQCTDAVYCLFAAFIVGEIKISLYTN